MGHPSPAYSTKTGMFNQLCVAINGLETLSVDVVETDRENRYSDKPDTRFLSALCAQ
jgi:hypothetical protein